MLYSTYLFEAEHDVCSFDELDRYAPGIAEDEYFVAVGSNLVRMQGRAGSDELGLYCLDVIDLERDMQQQGIHRGVIRDGLGGIVIDLNHHIFIGVGKEVHRHRRLALAFDFQIQVFDPPVGHLDRIFDVNADVLKPYPIVVCFVCIHRIAPHT